jgi:two-component system, chemotaxis family, chemotaxis protein CheY
MRILIVDDSPTVREILVKTLTLANFEVLQAENGVKGLKTLETEPVDLIISDVNMTVMGGFEFVTMVRERPAHAFTPVLFLTTENGADFRQIGREVGATGWLTKPIDPGKLISTINRICN